MIRRKEYWYSSIALLLGIALLVWMPFSKVSAVESVGNLAEGKIASELMSEISADEYLDFVVKLTTQEDTSDIAVKDSKDTQAEIVKQKVEIIETLQHTATATQKELISYLEEQQKAGLVQSFESHFIVNSIHVIAKQSVMDEIAKRSDVSKIVSNKIETEKETPIENPISFSMYTSREAYIPWNLKAILADKAYQSGYKGKDIVVGIIDSGVDASHPVLKDSWRGNDANEAVYSWFDATAAHSSSPIDETGHGTHVAGTILGKYPDKDTLLGVAPEAKWIAARVFDKDGETTLNIILKAGEWMLAPTDEKGTAHPEQAPKVINNSWGGNSEDEFFRDIVKKWRESGILPVFSAGNTGLFNEGGKGSIGTPASYPESFAVGALNLNDKIAKFSLRGPSTYEGDVKPDISAPGVNIYSSIPGGKYILRSGTSMAGPHVAGVAALVYAVNPDLTVDEVEKILRESATPLSDSENVGTPNFAYGYGKVNAYLASEMAKSFKDKKEKFGMIGGKVVIQQEDTKAPVINHSPMKTIFSSYAIDITFGVSDDNGVEAVEYYLAAGNKDGEFQKIETQFVSGTKVAGEYRVTIKPEMLTEDTMRYYIKAIDINGKVTQTDVYPVTVGESVKKGYSQDFEDNIDGIELGGKSPMWQWGVPKDIPQHGAEGNKVIGTNLDGDYESLKDSIFVLPPIELAADEHVALTFDHWHDLGHYAYAFYDTAEVWIGEITADNVKAEDIQYKLHRSYKFKSDNWEKEYIDLSQYQGKKISVMFGMRGADMKGEEGHKGWYVDNIAIAEASKEIPQAPHEWLRFTYKEVGSCVVSFKQLEDPKVTSYCLYRSTEKDGKYELVNELKKEDIKYQSTSISDIPLPQKGTYYYYVTAKIGHNESEPTKIFSHTFTEGTEKVFIDFEKDNGGFTSTADEKGNRWEYGKYDNPEKPEFASRPKVSTSKGKNAGDGLWGTVLFDYRQPEATYTLESADINLTGLSEGMMYFQQWFNTFGRKGSIEYYGEIYGPYDDDTGYIEFSKDGGENWEKVYTLDDDMIDDEQGYRIRGAWFTEHIKIPAEYATDKFRIKFVLETGTDKKVTGCGGWYIDDIYITEQAEKISEPEKPIVPAFALENMQLMTTSESTQKTTTENAVTYGTVNGKVTIKETGISAPLELGTGQFIMKHPVGHYTLVASAKGYKTTEIAVDIKENESAEQTIVLEQLKPGNLTAQFTSTIDQTLENVVTKIYADEETTPLATVEGTTINITNLLPGHYTLIITAKDHRTLTKEVVISEEAATDLGEVNLSKITTPEDATISNLSHDDGVGESMVGNLTDGKTAAVKFSVSEPSQIKTIKYRLGTEKNGSIADKHFIYSIYGANNQDELLGQLIYGPKDYHITENGQWIEITLDDTVIVDGDFYVAYTQADLGQDPLVLAVDDSTKGFGYSFKLINGAWNEPSEEGAFMIQAVVAPIKEVEKPVDPDNGGETPEPVDPDNGGETPAPVEPVDPVNGGDTPEPVKPVDPVKPVLPPKPEKDFGWKYDLKAHKWQYLDSQKQAKTATWQDGCYLTEDGYMAEAEWIFDKNYHSWYYLRANGHYASNEWVGSYYLKEWGDMAKTEWVYDNHYNSWYYLKEDGHYASNEWVGSYYLKEWGDMAKTEWVYDNHYNSWYYLKEDGHYASNEWVGSYYLKEWGDMAKTEWVYDNHYNSWYYLKEDGHYASNEWVGSYYLKEWGAMAQSEWIFDSHYDAWYYLKDNGQYAHNETINGYKLDLSGKWIK
ncbi:bacillopeptidase F [Granulicatella balaenopterae]|uniref:Bacillopeptidase F n=1 Tax=Granulicatella balaenopterae TaxID=137733 RepID=A0A1H9MTE5_9LACT|nr:bacillopeptidase F [Granulicatella balaenopterae]